MALYGAALFAAIGLSVFLLRAKAGLYLFEFGDESEKFVAAQMMLHGMTLYRDIFAHHGPVSYIIAHLYAALVSPTDFSYIRWVMVILALMSAASIYLSPSLKNTPARLWTVGVFLSLLSSIWVLQGIHMVLYHQIGGFLLVVPVTQLFVPLLLGDTPRKAGVVFSGLAIVISCFTAYSFGPTSVLLVLACLILVFTRTGMAGFRRFALYFTAGLAIGLLLLLSWMSVFSDLKGYLVYHFYFNQAVYSRFIDFSLADVKNVFKLSFTPATTIHSFVLVGFVSWLFVLASRFFPAADNKLRFWGSMAILIFVFAIALVNPRGGIGIHDAGFVILNMSLFALSAALCLQSPRFSTPRASAAQIVIGAMATIVAVLIFEQVSRHGISSPHQTPKNELRQHVVRMRPADAPVFEFIRSVSKPEGDMLALIFNPGVYIRSDRRPASGHYYYLPWQAAYNKNSVGGYKIDICKDIAERRPSVIFFDDWKVLQTYPIDEYEPCVPAIIKDKYTAVGNGSQLYLRSDLLTADTKSHQAEDMRLQPSPQLSTEQPLKLSMTTGPASQKGLKRIGIRFGTYAQQNAGEAELRLVRADGTEYRQIFPLSDLADNAYRHFDLDGSSYVSGQIIGVSGGGVSTWESHATNGEVLTCLTYEYADGKLGFTSGCPLY
ncbi:hypothetical protein CR159_20195 [Pollutimonas subterranea]|uniref:Uncharacterized protein n=1 Tax=Pollutimonas subterranea TaxID=2045210 RepID=A0A2N4TZ71_9BURK|nr:hypothetical protein CR159_20195 [Pollutimonas subterranea]